MVAWGVLVVVVGAAVASFIGYRAPRFADLYSGFGNFLWAPTRLVLGWWYLLWAIPIAALAVLVVAVRQPEVAGAQRRPVALLVALFALAIVLGVLASLALYAPILLLGQPI